MAIVKLSEALDRAKLGEPLTLGELLRKIDPAPRTIRAGAGLPRSALRGTLCRDLGAGAAITGVARALRKGPTQA